MAQAGTAGPIFSIPLHTAPPVPRRTVTYRWVALGLAAGWMLLLTGLLLSATTSTPTRAPDGAVHTTTRTVASSDPGGVALFLAFLAVCWVVTAVSLRRRVRTDSEAAGRSGYVAAGILLVLGVLSLANIGLALIVLAFALAVASRPIHRPRPVPGERVIPPTPS